MDETVLGTIAELWRFPVKSMQGEQLTDGVLGPQSLDGDRRYAVRGVDDERLLTAKRVGALLEATARTGADGAVTITLPEGTELAADDPAVHGALSDWLGRPVLLVAADDGATRAFEMSFDADQPDQDLFEWACPDGTFLDLAAAHLLTDASLAAARALHPDGDWDVRRFRPTALIDTATDVAVADVAAGGFVEDAWVGRTLSLGRAELQVLMPTVRCPMPSRAQPGLARDTGVAAALRDHHENNLGVYAAVTSAGPVAVGDPLHLTA
jgi:uncharacterized protein YcbX